MIDSKCTSPVHMKGCVREVFAEHTFLRKKRNRYASKNEPLNSLLCLEAREMKWNGYDLFTPLSFFFLSLSFSLIFDAIVPLSFNFSYFYSKMLFYGNDNLHVIDFIN